MFHKKHLPSSSQINISKCFESFKSVFKILPYTDILFKNNLNIFKAGNTLKKYCEMIGQINIELIIGKIICKYFNN